jgi:Acetyltransferase (GNAT) domain
MFIHLKEQDSWHSFASRIQSLDVYYDQNYVSLIAPKDNGVAEAVYYEDGFSKIFYPYIKRNIPMKDQTYYDIITPYGYGGPFVEGEVARLNEFYQVFKLHCLKQNIVTEKVKSHPLYTNLDVLSKIMPLEFIHNTTALDLKNPYELINAGYSKSTKRNINKAIKNGVLIIEDTSLKYLEEFVQIYYETMKRNQADHSYFFTSSYFHKLMKPSIFYHPRLLIAKYQDRVIGGLIVLIGKQAAHYHLGASSAEFLPLRANNLLFDYMIRLCKEKHADFLHLGGGTKGNDDLLRFKSSFTNKNYLDFYIGKHVINEGVYNALNQKKTTKESNFFPPYRY